ncbi:MAG: thiolase family protein [Actinobacteria bacterium]|nr:thiolase family protein [Actinomycetota bacterium]
MTQDVFIVDACRTPTGRVNGALAGLRPDDLTAGIVGALLRRNPFLDPGQIDDVYWGAANQAGEDNRNVARMGVLLAGLPPAVPGATVNRLCGSGLEAVSAAARAIAVGEADLCLAGGVESMTRAPFVIPRPDRAFPRQLTTFDTRLGWRMVNPVMEKRYPPIPLGETAEKVAEQYRVDRESQDRFALESHAKAAAATDAGRFGDELEAVDGVDLASDETIKRGLTLEGLARMEPVFVKGGTVTGGNSSPLSDGAAGVALMSGRMAEEAGITPLARYVTTAAAGVHPDVMGIGPVPATRRALARAGWSIGDLDLVELNEAFASQSLAVIGELGLDPETVNPNGGAIALGHPLGCSGARILTTLVHEMRRRGSGRGLATMCIGVGQGIAMLVERP